MTKRAKAKYKIDRRMGENIWAVPRARSTSVYGPGQHGQRRAKGSLRLWHPASGQAEAQGLLRQHHRAAVPQILHEAAAPRRHGREHDRPARAPPRRGGLSRQVRAHPVCRPPVISHGHIKVNGRRPPVASYHVKSGHLVEIKGKFPRGNCCWRSKPTPSPSETCRITSRLIMPGARRHGHSYFRALPSARSQTSSSRTKSSSSISALTEIRHPLEKAGACRSRPKISPSAARLPAVLSRSRGRQSINVNTVPRQKTMLRSGNREPSASSSISTASALSS